MENISKSIIAVMNEVNNIGKNTVVGKGNNAYKAVSDKDVKYAIRSSMGKNGLCIMSTGIQSKIQIDRWEETNDYGTKTKQSVFTEVETKYLLLHTSGESIELAGYGQGVDSQDKGAGKATTYALKNVLINLFLVPTGEDTDNTHSNDITVPQKAYNNDGVKKEWYNDTAKHIEKWAELVTKGKTTGKALVAKVTDNGNKMIKNADKEMILALDK